MKTPREILLSRHAYATPQLDALRRAALHHVTPAGQPFFAQLWRELFWSPRRVWAGLAAAWLVIIAANWSMGEPASSAAPPPTASAERLALWRQQLELRRELLGSLPPDPAEPRRTTPAPRTERKPSYLFA